MVGTLDYSKLKFTKNKKIQECKDCTLLDFFFVANYLKDEILLEALGGKKLPFIADFDCCNTHPMMTLPIGCEIELDATEKKVLIIEDWLK